MAIQVTSYGETNVGRKRAHNEDNFLSFPERMLFVVADGMGGHGYGEVASQMVVETMRKFYDHSLGNEDATWPNRDERGRTLSENMLNAGFRYSNYAIWERGHSDAKYKNMGTTVVGIHFDNGEVAVAHIGDSRVYRLRAGELVQLTEDHSLLNDYKKMAVLTPEEEENFPHKNIIVRACGLKDEVLVDVMHESPQVGDVYMLCSDGLNGELTNPQIRDIMAKHNGDVTGMAQQLIKDACDAGGKDNVTALCVRVDAL